MSIPSKIEEASGDIIWENVESCDACESKDFKLYMESDIPRWFEGKPMRLLECRNCGLVFASPRPLEKQVFEYLVGNDEKGKAAVKRKLERPNMMNIHRNHLKAAIEILDYQPETMFDMGFGAGTLMMAAEELGIKAYGNDVNKSAVDKINELGMIAYLGKTQDLILPENFFDLVFNFDYLEHTYRPMGDLERCFTLLKPGGLLYLKTLFLGCPSHKAKGEGWQLFIE